MTDDLFLVPKGDGSGNLQIDIVEIVKSESRLSQVATVNVDTAPELLYTYNDVWLKLDRLVAHVAFEKDRAENFHKQARAEARLLCTADFMNQKGHSKPSADIRDALVEMDKNVIQTKDRLDEITVVLAILKGKKDAFYNAYNSVKKLTANGTLPPRGYGASDSPRPHFSPNYEQIKNKATSFDSSLPEEFGLPKL